MNGHICHVEIPADNVGALQKFYGGIFEWDFDKVPGDIEYYGIRHGDQKPTAGMMPRQAPGQTPTFYVCVESVQEALDKAEGEGATVVVPRNRCQGHGLVCRCAGPPKKPFRSVAGR